MSHRNEQGKQVTITMSESHAQTLMRALDLYSRIGLGQFESVVGVYDYNFHLELIDHNCLREHMDRAKISVGHPKSGSYGIHNPKVSDDFRVAYDIQQIVRNKIAWARSPKGGFGVDFNEPMQASKLPLPTCEITEKKG